MREGSAASLRQVAGEGKQPVVYEVVLCRKHVGGSAGEEEGPTNGGGADMLGSAAGRGAGSRQTSAEAAGRHARCTEKATAAGEAGSSTETMCRNDGGRMHGVLKKLQQQGEAISSRGSAGG